MLGARPGVRPVAEVAEARRGRDGVSERRQLDLDAKQGGVEVTGERRVGRPEFDVAAEGIVDESAGYHERHTSWRWSAESAAAPAASGWPGTWWRACTTPRATASARSGWTASRTRRGRAFAADLSAVGRAALREWSAREDHTNLLLFRSDYRQPFGTFRGRLPGGPELAEGYGVMESHDVRW